MEQIAKESDGVFGEILTSDNGKESYQEEERRKIQETIKQQLGKIDPMIENLKDETILVEMLKKVKAILVGTSNPHADASQISTPNPKDAHNKFKQAANLLDKIQVLLDDIENMEDHIVNRLEKFGSSFWDWLLNQPEYRLQNIFCGLQWWMNNVEFLGDGQIRIGDEIYEWDDLVDVCCFFG